MESVHFQRVVNQEGETKAQRVAQFTHNGTDQRTFDATANWEPQKVPAGIKIFTTAGLPISLTWEAMS